MQNLKFIISEKRPLFLFLIKTLYSISKINEIEVLLYSDDFIFVDFVECSGGLVQLWWVVSIVTTFSISLQCIDVEVMVD